MIRRRFPAIALAVVATLVLAPSANGQSVPAEPLAIRSVSNRADLVSGGDVLLEILGAAPDDLTVRVNGRDETSGFVRRANGQLLGLVDGLVMGPNEVRATTSSGSAVLTVTNHSMGGPVFSGPQIWPWSCSAEGVFDDQCSAPSQFRFVMRSVSGVWREIDPSAPIPLDADVVTTDEGHSVPMVVRVERGTANRGIHEIAILQTPEEELEVGRRQPGWNGKLHVPLGGGCTPGHAQTSVPFDVSPTDDENWVYHSVIINRALERGYAVASSGMNILGDNCNPVVSAETLLIIKEHIAETHGEIRFTTTEGCSGGGMQQYLFADHYPGLVDGITPACSFPDVWTAIREAADCRVLQHVFDDLAPEAFADPAVQAAIAGHASVGVCRSSWDSDVQSRSFADVWLNPRTGCGISSARVYDPETNPDGVRCTIQDYQGNLWGHRPDGFANRPYDNVGVQYGLEALSSGAITAEQFVLVNELVGGLDLDFEFTSHRTVADPPAVERAYSNGHLVMGRHLDEVPIVDIRGSSNHEIHSDVHSYMVRERMDKALGGHANQIIWTNGPAQVPDREAVEAAFDLVDRWLTAIEADTSDLPLAEKVAGHQPPDAVDACWINGVRIDDRATCSSAFPYFGDPRIAAGSPLSDDIVKCALAPLERGQHPGAFTDSQWERLVDVFPNGVCDWHATMARPIAEPWLDFSGGPQGRPMGAAPTSVLASADATGPVSATGSDHRLPATGGAPAVVGLGLSGLAASMRPRRGRGRG